MYKPYTTPYMWHPVNNLCHSMSPCACLVCNIRPHSAGRPCISAAWQFPEMSCSLRRRRCYRYWIQFSQRNMVKRTNRVWNIDFRTHKVRIWYSSMFPNVIPIHHIPTHRVSLLNSIHKVHAYVCQCKYIHGYAFCFINAQIDTYLLDAAVPGRL